MRISIIYFLLVLFCACQIPFTPNNYEYGEEFELALGNEVRIGVEKIFVEFVDVPEDSRCPLNVNCFWAGNGVVQLQIDHTDVQLNTYLEPTNTAIDNMHIELLNLDPYPEYPHQIEKEDYKVRLLITKQ